MNLAGRNLLILLTLCIRIKATIDGFKGVPGISPDPLGFADYSASLSANGSLLVLGHSNGSALFYLNNGTDFVFFQIISPSTIYIDFIEISSDQEWVFMPKRNILVGYRLQNGAYMPAINYTFPLVQTSDLDFRFEYV